MSRRIIAASFLLLALDLATGTVRAQSVGDVDHAMHAMDLRMRALNAARKNLQRIDLRRNGQEADAAREIADADTIVFTAAVKVFTVAYIVTGMKCPEDLHFTLQQFALVADLFVTTADAELTHVDANIRSVATPTALAEATSIRDVIVDLRDFLKPFAVKG